MMRLLLAMVLLLIVTSRIATRYDKLAQRFASFIALVAAFVWLS